MLAVLTAGCRTLPPPVEARRGDEIVVAGQFFHTGTRVVTWQDAGGFNAYAGPPRPAGEAPDNYSARAKVAARDLPALQAEVDQFVLHYDGSGLSRLCFDVLQKRRLSVHFMLDVDGTIYQTLDLQERAWHATTANDRSIGVEIANIGAYPPGDDKKMNDWYRHDATGRPRLRLPAQTPLQFDGGPARPEPVQGVVQGQTLVQYDLTPQQYAALIKLTAALCRVFPKIQCDYPRDAAGRLVPHKLPDAALVRYQGVLGHYHIQTNKIDPGPAFDWDKLSNGARQLLQAQ
ncbi:MAG: N-acetylmuramoyl-L-alanine amidase [Opitutaceae bacterium]|nr:N-acetylmuramoyl-L-alanine amidase [Opitutaceae bacterium]